jgi:carbamoyl-phosphate synthase large subunit
MAENMTVLISSAGRRVELLECFRRSGLELGIPIRLLACDVAPQLSAACQRADDSFSVPACTASEFIPKLLERCGKENVRLLIPTIDPELEIIAQHREEFARLGTEISVSDFELVKKARNKLSTHLFLAAHNLPTPGTYLLPDAAKNAAALRYPVIVKPLRGSSSVGTQLCATMEELVSLRATSSDHVVQEYHLGREYTVHLFFDRGNLRSIVPHRRLEVRAGEVSKAVTKRVPELIRLGEKLGELIKEQAFGVLCFQAMLSANGSLAIFELNARFGGGYPLVHQAGATFTKWLLEIAAGLPCSAHDRWRENVLMLRYDAAVFRDDDQAGA